MEMLNKFRSRLAEVRTQQSISTRSDQEKEAEAIGGKEDAKTRKRKAEESTVGEEDDPALGDSTWWVGDQ